MLLRLFLCVATDNTCHVLRGTGEALAGSSLVNPLTCVAFLWRLNLREVGDGCVSKAGLR